MDTRYRGMGVDQQGFYWQNHDDTGMDLTNRGTGQCRQMEVEKNRQGLWCVFRVLLILDQEESQRADQTTCVF